MAIALGFRMSAGPSSGFAAQSNALSAGL